MEIVPGVYETLINKDLESKIKEAESEKNLICNLADIDEAESPSMLAQYLSQVIQRKLEDETLSVEEKADYVNRILTNSGIAEGEAIACKEQFLSEVKTKAQKAKDIATGAKSVRPLSGFRVSNLFTGGNSEISLGSEIQRDIFSSDQIYIIVSFLKLSGLHLIYDDLKSFCCQEGHSLKIITTTYCGVTEVKAVKMLSELPNTEIRISYNTQIERLHAKSYIFVRNSGQNTAYIGSSNLSKSAQTDGLEWNIRVTNEENPHIIKAALAQFEIYWNSQNFEDFNVGGIDKFNKEMNLVKQRMNGHQDLGMLQRYQILPHQKRILEKLDVVRETGCMKNLVVAATGTGKTVISAFDYSRFRASHKGHDKLLFIAHREEILRQSLHTYQSVLSDANFGSLWVGQNKPTEFDHLFVSVQTFCSQYDVVFSKFAPDEYDYIVVDEAHHIAADSYRTIIKHFRPTILMGLTATPERMDGKSLLPDFDNKISAEIRLPQALDEGLLTPFQYFCISDQTDLTDEDLWQGKKYVISKLSAKLRTPDRARLIMERLSYYLNDEHACKALCFCADKEHAQFMSDCFCKCGFKSAWLTSDNSEERFQLNKQLENGEINYLFVVDMFNEGVDIPSVDTVLFLRPTESLTIYLQQLGRGLRLAPNKTILTVLDFVAQVNKKYDFASRFRSLLSKPGVSIEKEIKEGFLHLPHGCTIHMEEVAQRYILDSIKATIYNTTRLVQEIQSYPNIPSLKDFIESNGQDIRLIYKGGRCWTSLLKMAGKLTYEEDANTKLLENGIGNLVHINSLAYLNFIEKSLSYKGCFKASDEAENTFSLMLYYNLFKDKISKLGVSDIYEALSRLKKYPLFVSEILELVAYLKDNLEIKTESIGNGFPSVLEVYGCYTREEAFCLVGKQTANKKMQGSAAGVINIEDYGCEFFFVTLNKSDKDFSPTTQYNDYVVSENFFHWQSQNTDSHSGKGSRFVYQKKNGKKFVLFVRENKKDAFGNTCPFYCFGCVDYISSTGDYPMNIKWKTQKKIMPMFLSAV